MHTTPRAHSPAEQAEQECDGEQIRRHEDSLNAAVKC
jgi:hypothetical protein